MADDKAAAGEKKEEKPKKALKSGGIEMKTVNTPIWRVFAAEGAKALQVQIQFYLDDAPDGSPVETRDSDGMAEHTFRMTAKSKGNLRAQIVGESVNCTETVVPLKSKGGEKKDYFLRGEPTGREQFDDEGHSSVVLTPGVFDNSGKRQKTEIKIVSNDKPFDVVCDPCSSFVSSTIDPPSHTINVTAMTTIKIIATQPGRYEFDVFDTSRPLRFQFTMAGADPNRKRPAKGAGIWAWANYYFHGGDPK